MQYITRVNKVEEVEEVELQWPIFNFKTLLRVNSIFFFKWISAWVCRMAAQNLTNFDSGNDFLSYGSKYYGRD